MKQEGGDEAVFLAVGLEGGRGQARIAHELAHDADTGAFGFSEVDLVEHGGDVRIARYRTGLAPALLGDERVPGIANFEPIRIPDDLHGPVLAVTAVHDGIDHGFT